MAIPPPPSPSGPVPPPSPSDPVPGAAPSAPSEPAPATAPSEPAPATAPSTPFGPTPGAAPAAPSAPSTPPGYYPQQAYYAPGWSPQATGPAGPAGPSRRSHTRLFLGLAIGLASALLITGGVVGFRYWQQTRSLGDITGETTASSRQVETGHCIADLPEDGSVGSVTLVPCDKPHEAQVVGTYALQHDGWPGQEAVDAEVAASCEMDSAQAAEGFRAVVWTPSESSWAQGDNRGVCIAWYADGGVTGSFADGDVAVP